MRDLPIKSNAGFLILTIEPEPDRTPLYDPNETAANEYINHHADKIIWADYQATALRESTAFSILIESPCNLSDFETQGFRFVCVERIEDGDVYGDRDGTVVVRQYDRHYVCEEN